MTIVVIRLGWPIRSRTTVPRSRRLDLPRFAGGCRCARTLRLDSMPGRQTYDLYGSKTLSLEEVRDAVTQATGVELNLRDSQHMGGAYYRGGEVGGVDLVVQHNWDEDGEPIEDEFPSHRVLCRLDRSDRADDAREALAPLPGLEFLRRTSG